MSTALPPLDSITGALLIGTWASSLLYTFEFLQALRYFRNFKDDSWMLKSYVAVAFTIDTISALGDYACVYLYTITHAGDPVYLTKQNWAVPVYVFTTSCVAILVQSFLAFRYWRFTNNITIVCFMSILILGAFGGGFYSGIIVVLFPAIKDRSKLRISGLVFFVTQVSSDIFIAAALVREFMKAKSRFREQRRVKNLLNRLVIRTIQTGTATAVIGTVALVIFGINDETNIPVGILNTLGRVYILSMLMNLNARVFGRPEALPTLSGAPQGTLAFAQGHSATYNLTSIQFRPASEGQSSSSNSGTTKSSGSVLEGQSSSNGTLKSSGSVMLPTLHSISESEAEPPEIEMVPIDCDAKRVPKV
ncbi:hypothetical protein C8R45DRAFT_1223661 [Mycena sanguinolenta]|nr:hypothetical protein C8R45DRAFT_1223661 [Mycena sanguinolenta]